MRIKDEMPKNGETFTHNGISYVVKPAKKGCEGCSLIKKDCWTLNRPICKGLGRCHDCIFIYADKSMED